MDIALAVQQCRPGAEWLCGETYESLEWLDAVQAKPTLEELEIAYQEVVAQSNKVEAAKAQVRAGYTVQPEGFTLALGDNDRNQFTQMLTLVQEALSLGLINNDTPQTIADKDGGKHTVSTLRLRQILVLYGLYYKGIWDTATTP